MGEKYYIILQSFEDGEIVFIEASNIEKAKIKAEEIEIKMKYGVMGIVPYHWLIEMKEALNNIELDS